MARLALLTFTAFLLSAPAALAHDGGEGTYGPANDKVVTNAGFIIIAFFPLFIALMSLLQWRLDRRKELRKAAEKARRARPEWHAGW